MAVETFYYACLTGLILALATRAGPRAAADVVFRTFRRQQLARFLPGLRKLGLDQLTHAGACAQYHYLSNQVGGVKVEAHDRWLRLEVMQRRDGGDPIREWRISRRLPPALAG